MIVSAWISKILVSTLIVYVIRAVDHKEIQTREIVQSRNSLLVHRGDGKRHFVNYYDYFQRRNITLIKHYNKKFNFFFVTCNNKLNVAMNWSLCSGPHDFLDESGSMMQEETSFAVERINSAKSRKNGKCEVLDIGANFGYFSLIALSMGCKVYAFEPDSKNFNVLMLNFLINGFTNYIAYNMPAGLGNTVNFDGWSAANPQTKNRSIPLKTVPISVILTYTKEIDWMKLDVEGFEEIVMKSVPRKLVLQSLSIEVTYYLYGYINYNVTYDYIDTNFKFKKHMETQKLIDIPMAQYTQLIDSTRCGETREKYNYCQYNVFAWN